MAPVRRVRVSVAREGAMGYIEKNLISGETLVYRTGLHWSVLFWPVVLTLLLDAGGIFCLLQKDQSIQYAGIGLLVVSGVVLAIAVVKRNAVEIGVTNRRVMIKTGIANRRSLEIMLPKVESIGIDEPPMGRLLGYGTVVIHGTGGTPEPFVKIAHPSEFRREVQQQIDAYQAR
jgi:membrane protein YdbS with pleckstrin-like domain